ncbi:integrase, catalytic region, zinc finger, CCHC-type containing protein [Tanacetum coccineum]
MSENKDKSHDTVIDLGARAKKNKDVVLKMDNSMQDEIEKIQRDSIEIQKGMQKRINILENDVQRCQKQSLGFELQLQHEKERRKCESSLKNVYETSWISKMEKLERLRAISSVRRPSHRDSSFKNSVLSNTKNSSEKVEVSDKTNKKSDVASKNVDSNKKIVTNDDIKNALITKNVLCVSYAINMLIPCHDNCLAKYKLNVHSKVKRALFTTSRTVKSKFKDPTPVISKTRFSIKTIQSNSLDTTPVVSKTKNAVVTPLSAKHKGIIPSVLVHSVSSVLEVAFRSKTNYVRNLEGDDLLTGDHESNFYTISIFDMAASLPVCIMSKANSTKSWLWHRRLSHLNFGTINDLTKHDLVDGIQKIKYGKRSPMFCLWSRGKRKKGFSST